MTGTLQIPQDVTAMSTGACYLYGVASGNHVICLGNIGIDGSEVYAISYRDICAVVHDCRPTPYQSRDEEKVKKWLLEHLRVLDEVKVKFGNIVPFSFDTIIESRGTGFPRENVTAWLKAEYERLLQLLSAVNGKDEYVIKVLYDTALVREQILQQSHTASMVQDSNRNNRPGLAYIYRQNLEKEVRAELETFCSKNLKDIFNRLKPFLDDLNIEKVKKAEDGKVMLLHLSCLVSREKVKALGEEVGKINSQPAFSVHFSGPWPPFTFVNRPLVREN